MRFRFPASVVASLAALASVPAAAGAVAYNFDFAFAAGTGTGPGQLSQPQGLAVDPSDGARGALRLEGEWSLADAGKKVEA